MELRALNQLRADNVAEQNFGDCKGISNLLVSLLNEAGLDAHHAWIGTRRLPYDYSLPSIVVDNHMICALNHNGEWIFLDGTDNTADWRFPSAHIQGKSVLIGSGQDYLIETVPIGQTADSRLEFNLNIKLTGNPISEAEGSIKFLGYETNTLMSWYQNTERDKQHKLPVYISEYYL